MSLTTLDVAELDLNVGCIARTWYVAARHLNALVAFLQTTSVILRRPERLKHLEGLIDFDDFKTCVN